MESKHVSHSKAYFFQTPRLYGRLSIDSKLQYGTYEIQIDRVPRVMHTVQMCVYGVVQKNQSKGMDWQIMNFSI